MYIHPFIAGILTIILIEIAAFITYAIISYYERNKK